MDNQISATKIAAFGMRAQADRLRHVSENIANADTPGYRRKTMAFDAARLPGDGFAEATGVRAGPVQLDQTELTDIYDPGHILADETGHYLGSNVDLMVELADAREAQRSYEANLNVIESARSMLMNTISLLRN